MSLDRHAGWSRAYELTKQSTYLDRPCKVPSMAQCNGCGGAVSEGKLCALCIAKMVAYHDGDYDDENDPAVKLYHQTAAKMNANTSSSSSGCALVVLALTSVSAVLAATGIGVENLIF